MESKLYETLDDVSVYRVLIKVVERRWVRVTARSVSEARYIANEHGHKLTSDGGCVNGLLKGISVETIEEVV